MYNDDNNNNNSNNHLYKQWVRLFGHSKLPVGVNVSVDGCFCLYMSALWWTNDLSRVSTTFAPAPLQPLTG